MAVRHFISREVGWLCPDQNSNSCVRPRCVICSRRHLSSLCTHFTIQVSDMTSLSGPFIILPRRMDQVSSKFIEGDWPPSHLPTPCIVPLLWFGVIHKNGFTNFTLNFTRYYVSIEKRVLILPWILQILWVYREDSFNRWSYAGVCNA
jgi:hypothetical protein